MSIPIFICNLYIFAILQLFHQSFFIQSSKYIVCVLSVTNKYTKLINVNVAYGKDGGKGFFFKKLSAHYAYFIWSILEYFDPFVTLVLVRIFRMKTNSIIVFEFYRNKFRVTPLVCKFPFSNVFNPF